MQQVKVNVVEPELFQAGCKGVAGGVFAEVGDPELGGDKQLFPVDAGLAYTFADFALVTVGSGCVDEAVSVLNGSADTSAVSSGLDWATPRPSAGIVSPLFNCNVGLRFVVMGTAP